MAFVSKYLAVLRISIQRGLLASLRTWLEPSADPDASAAGVLGCAYLFLISLVDVFDSTRQAAPLALINTAQSVIMALLKNEWVEMGDPAPSCRRTHGGAGAGALALVKPLPPKAVAGRPDFTRAKRPRLQSPPADRWAAVQDHALAPSLSPAATSPIRNSKGP